MDKKMMRAATVVMLLAAATCAMIPACKKSKKEDCPSCSGFCTTKTFVLYTTKDLGCGVITVRFYYPDGSEATSWKSTISVYDPAGPTPAFYNKNDINYHKRGYIWVASGNTFTYKATCSGRSWTGKVSVDACNPDFTDEAIELK